MNPFTILGLPERPDLTTDEVRAAWRRKARATHPDLQGGDAAAYAAAAAAYDTLKTPWGRSEAWADLTAPAPAGTAPAPATAARTARRAMASARLMPARIRHGRPGVLAARVLSAVILAVVAARSGAGPAPAAGVITGVGCWLALTARGDLAPPPGR